jgi:hypothetical protein
MAEVVAIRRVAVATLNCIAKHAAEWRRVSAVGDQARMLGEQMVVQLLLCDSGLDDGIRQFVVDLENAVHACEHHDYRARFQRILGPIPPVVALAERPDGEASVRGKPQDRRDFLCRSWVDHRSASATVGLGRSRVHLAAGVVGNDMLVSDDGPKFGR